MIKLKNVSTSLVSIYAPSVKFNRELMPGRVIPITDEEYEELTFDPGFMALVNGHYIKIEGVEEEQAVEIVENIVEADEIKRMLVESDVTAFAKLSLQSTTQKRSDEIWQHPS